MENNKANNANHFERFSCTPCTFSEMTPDTEAWYSRPTRYRGTKTGCTMMIDEAHRRPAAAPTRKPRRATDSFPNFITGGVQFGDTPDIVGPVLSEAMRAEATAWFERHRRSQTRDN
jgi:hypothetical protein